MQSNLNVLSLNYMRMILTQLESDNGEALLRSLSQASRLKEYFLIVFSLRRHELKPRRIENISIIPTDGINRAHALYRMYKFADQICRENAVDVIHTTDPTFTGFVGYLLKRKYGKPLNTCVFGGDPYDANWLKESIANRALASIPKHVIRICDGVQVDGKKVMSSLIRNGKVPHSKIFCFPNIPQRIKTFRQADGQAVRELLMKNRESKLLLFVGRLAGQKNVRFLLESFLQVTARFQAVRLVIIGEGEEEDHLRRTAARLKIASKTEWIRHVPTSRIAEYFRAADVVVLSSLYEGFPKVMMGASMAGVPIVSTDVGGVEEVIKRSGNGFVVPHGDQKQFAEKILFLLNNPEAARKMGRAGQRSAEKEFEPRKTISDQIEAWKEIAATAAVRRSRR